MKTIWKWQCAIALSANKRHNPDCHANLVNAIDIVNPDDMKMTTII
jgi:hypothetical protein